MNTKFFVNLIGSIVFIASVSFIAVWLVRSTGGTPHMSRSAMRKALVNEIERNISVVEETSSYDHE